MSSAGPRVAQLPTWPRRRVVASLVVAVALGLAGCAGPGRIAGEGPAFERSGRFAVTVTDAGAAVEAVQGGFAWRDTGRRLRLDLVNPLGSTLARITVEPSGATLEHANGTTEQAPDADALVAKVMGTALPVSSLRDWLQGRTGPSPVTAMERDSAGRPTAFMQEGWQLHLTRFDAVGPGLLRLERRDGGRRISVRLAMDTPATP